MTGLITSHKPMDELDLALMPHWAVGITTGICVGAQLLTKDGRHTGNAVVTGRGLTLSTGVRTWAVLTDAGNSLVLCDEEIKQLFHDPGTRWVVDVDSYPGRQRQQGADQELEACREWVSKYLPYLGDFPMPEDKLRAARRPRPPSLKERIAAAITDGNVSTALELLNEALPNE